MKKPGKLLLDHFDRIAGSQPSFTKIGDLVHVAIYAGFPKRGTRTGFTIGLSHCHPPGGGHKELTISMRDSDDSWACACGFVADQLGECCPFTCGELINFRAQIARSSPMSAFVAVHPLHLSARDAVVDIGVRKVEIMQLLPLYADEYRWLKGGGNLEVFLKACSSSVSMNPARRVHVPRE